MNKPTRNIHPLFKIANDAIVDLPTPSTIRGWWNFGLLLGICLVTQTVTGLFLAIHYCPNFDIAFSRLRHICRDVNYGWLLRTLHAIGASLFFICIYLHTGFIQCPDTDHLPRPQCVICATVLGNEALKLSQLIWHLKTKHSHPVNKPFNSLCVKEMHLK